MKASCDAIAKKNRSTQELTTKEITEFIANVGLISAKIPLKFGKKIFQGM